MRTFNTEIGEIEFAGNVGECLDDFIRAYGKNESEELTEFLVAYELFKNAIRDSDDRDEALFAAMENIPVLKAAIEEIGKKIVMM